MITICDEIMNAGMFYYVLCPANRFSWWLKNTHKIRYPVPEKEFDYWMARYYFESEDY